jgi:hypothetical protein
MSLESPTANQGSRKEPCDSQGHVMRMVAKDSPHQFTKLLVFHLIHSNCPTGPVCEYIMLSTRSWWCRSGVRALYTLPTLPSLICVTLAGPVVFSLVAPLDISWSFLIRLLIRTSSPCSLEKNANLPNR